MGLKVRKNVRNKETNTDTPAEFELGNTLLTLRGGGGERKVGERGGRETTEEGRRREEAWR